MQAVGPSCVILILVIELPLTKGVQLLFPRHLVISVYHSCHIGTLHNINFHSGNLSGFAKQCILGISFLE